MEKLKHHILNEIKEKRLDAVAGAKMLRGLANSISNAEPIAIVGIAARLPQADDCDAYWENLQSKISSVRTFPKSRRVFTDHYLPDHLIDDDQAYQIQGYLDDISRFNPKFFGFSEAEASKMSPLQRLVLECSYEALDDAGYAGRALSGTKTSVYVGNAQLGEPRYKDFMETLDGSAFIGNANSILPSRLAYRIGLEGNCTIVDSACSSGLLAVHNACEELRTGSVSAAVVCGAALNLFPVKSDRVTILESPQSAIHPFDDNADGTVWGEGVCSVMLKRLDNALSDGDKIYAVIRGSGANNDGASNGITAPNMQRQKELLEEVWTRFGINAEDIKYIEAHGTGTELGDPIEVKSITESFAGRTQRRQFCALGTCKGNIGHLIGASGVAALIKSALSLYYGEIPPMYGFTFPNKYIDFSKTPLYICDEKLTIPQEDESFLIAINNFGISGTNVHAVLGKAPMRSNLRPEQKTKSGTMRDYFIGCDYYWTDSSGQPISERAFGTIIAETQEVNQYKVTLTADKWYLHEHKVLKKPTLPATAMLEMMYMAASRHLETQTITIEDFYITSSVIVEDSRDLIVKTSKNSAQAVTIELLIDVNSASENAYDCEWLVCASAYAEKARKPAATAPAIPSFDAVGRCFHVNRQVDGKIEYGPRWDCVTSYMATDRECTMAIELDKLYLSDLEIHKIHPALMDLALNGLSFQLEGNYLPFTSERVTMYRPLENSFYSFIQFDNEKSTEHTRYYNIILFDKLGIMAEVRGYAVRQVTSIDNTDTQECLSLVWKKTTGADNKTSPQIERCLCISMGEGGLTMRVAEELPFVEKVLIPEYETGRIKKAIRNASDRGIDSVLLSIDIQDTPAYSQSMLLAVLEGVKEIVKTGGIHSIFIITQNDMIQTEKGLYPEPLSAALGSLVRSINNEIIGVNGRHIHLCGDVSAQRAAREILHGGGTEVALFGNDEKYLPELCSNRLRFSIEESKDNAKVFLIIGASGGLGTMLALHICEPGTTILLVSRSGRRNKELEIHAAKNNTRLEYLKTNVSDVDQMVSLQDYIASNYNEVCCIYNLAGVADSQFISELDYDVAAGVMAPKIIGSHTILQLAHHVSAKKVVFFSSVSALIGTPGQSVYSASNAYMDAIALKSASKSLQVVSIQLPAIQEIGMAAEHGADYTSVFYSMPPEELRKWFDRFIYCESGVYCPARINYTFELLDKMAWNLSVGLTAKFNRKNKRKDKIKTHLVTTVLAGRSDSQYTESEKKLADIWSQALECKTVDIDENFFESGGNSIIAIDIANRVRDAFDKKIDISSFFKNSTVRKLAAFIDGTQGKTGITIPLAPNMEHYPLSSEQRRIYALQSLNPQSLAYNLPIALELSGLIDIEKIERIFEYILQNNASLRTKFIMKEEDVRQEICDGHQYKLEILNIPDNLSPQDLNRAIDRFVKPFDLAGGLLLRTLLLRESETHNYLIVDTHHIAADGYSMSLILRAFIAAYSGEAENPQALRYVDYAVWAQSRNDAEYAIAREYWINTLSDEIPVLELPYDNHRPAVQSDCGSTMQFIIGAKQAAKLKAIASENGYTAGLILMTAFGLLLSKYAYLEDLVVGIPFAGRDNSQIESVVGMFVNTLPIRLRPENGMRYIQYLEASNAAYVEGMKNSCYNISNLIRELNLERDLSRNPLFDVMFTFQNTNSEIEITDAITPIINISLNDVAIQSVPYEKGTAKLDLTLEVIEREGNYVCIFEYSTDLFERQTIDGFTESYVNILDQVLDNPCMMLEDISVISSSEQEQIMQEFNDTACPYSDNETVVDLFEMQVMKTPDHIAVVAEKATLTYAALNMRANAIAHRLRETGVKPNDFVAIIAERSIEMIVGIYGILKSGAAYVPIAPDYPEQRIWYMLADSGAKAVLTQEPLKVNIENTIALSLHDAEEWNDPGNLAHVNVPDDLAYMIYTSGTTGNPKGVMCHHRGLINRIEWMQSRYPIGSTDAIVQKTTYTFDVSVWEIIWWGFTGAKVVMLKPGGEREPAVICDAIEREQVTTIHFVPSMLKAFLLYLSENNEDTPKIRSLRYVFSSGEALKPEYVSDFYQQITSKGYHARLTNFYGPTEASIDVTYYDCQKYQEIIPIGKPIANTAIYIRNGNGLCGIGVSGELCIAGVGVAKGYCGLEMLTAERFIQNPYGKGKLYRTGDLARWLPDGNIEYLGRLDEQVKIRGFRIELEEIAKVIRKQHGIIDAALIVRSNDGDDKYICAYIVASEEINIEQLTTQMKKDLPAYMIPSAFMQIEAIPVGANGKLNRSALPPITKGVAGEYIAPSSEMERVLTDVVGRILGKSNIGIKDDFFRLGGDSIKAIQLSARLRQAGYLLDIQDMYECSSIEILARRVKKSLVAACQTPVTGKAPLLPIQRDFFASGLAFPNHFNQEIICTYDGRIDSGAMERALRRLIAHHDALRLCFPRGTPMTQVNRAATEDNLFILQEYTFEQTDEWEITKKINTAHTLMDIQNGALLVSLVFHTSKRDYLFLVAHHLVCDGVSWRIILEDIEGLYADECGMADYSLPPKTSSYLEWCRFVEQRGNSGRVLEQQDYWKNICREDKYKKKQYRIKEIRREVIEIDQKTTSIIRENCFKLRTLTFNEILLLAFSESTKSLEALIPTYIMLESHGREEISNRLDVTRTVGWFTTVYPFNIPFSDKIDRIYNLALIKESQKQIPYNGFDFGLLKYSQYSKESLRSSDVIINYMGDFTEPHIQSEFKLCNTITGTLSSPQNAARYNLEINAFGLDDTMQIVIDYTPQYSENDIALITDNMVESIQNTAVALQRASVMLTPYDYGSNHITMADLQRITAVYSQKTIAKIYSLSPMQQNILTVAMIGSSSDTYYERFSFLLGGAVDADIMRKSFEMVINTHDVFKTVFFHDSISEPVQIVLTKADADFRFTELHDENTAALIQEVLEEDRAEGFDIFAGKLLRMRLLRINESENYVIFSFHHIILDGWCISLVMNEIFETYFSLQSNVVPTLQEVFSYADYIRSFNSSSKQESALFWQEHLSGLDGAVELPSKLKSAAATYVQGNIEIHISSQTIDKVTELAKKWRATISMVFQSVWAVMLGRLSSRDHVVFGYVVSGRNPELPGVNHMLGLFINTLPLHVILRHDDTFFALVEQVRQYNIEAEKHCFLTIGDIAQSSDLNVNIVDYAMVFENYPVVGELDFSKKEQEYKGMHISEAEYFEQSTLGMSIKVIPGQDYTLVFRYNRELHDDASVHSMAGSFIELLEQIAKCPETTVGCLCEGEEDSLDGFNDILE